jgi:5-carboxymethyl-2-hydroxymuconate isomerase
MPIGVVTFKNTGESIRVGKIICMGRNYPEHAREMNAEIPSAPVVFLKPPTALLSDGGEVVIPPISRVLHYEAEMVVAIGKDGKHIVPGTELDHVLGYAVGLDMTLRDIQSDAKSKGLPWTVAKGFDTSAPVSPVVDKKEVLDPHNLILTLKINGQTRQQAGTGAMIFRIDRIIAYLSTIFTLERGDLIFTGTPEGVGRVRSGDILEAELTSVGRLSVRIQ